jgi:hypothetical protein
LTAPGSSRPAQGSNRRLQHLLLLHLLFDLLMAKGAAAVVFLPQQVQQQ